MMSRLLASLLMCGVISALGLKSNAQSLEQAMADALAASQEANEKFRGDIQAMSELRTRLSGLLSMQGCDCDTPKGGCSYQAELIPGEERSELIITASVSRPLCARVGTYISTQFAIDNGLPAYEDFTYLREAKHSEWVSKSSWNGRQPILLDGGSCQLCATGDSLFCDESADVVATYSPQATASAQAASDMEDPVAQMKASGMMVDLTRSTEEQMNLLYQVASEAEALVNLVQSNQAICQ